MSDRLDELVELLAERVAERVAELLDVDPKTIRAAIHRGELRAVRVGEAWRVDLAELPAVDAGDGPSAPGRRRASRRPPSGQFAALARLPYAAGDTKSGPPARQRRGPGTGDTSSHA